MSKVKSNPWASFMDQVDVRILDVAEAYMRDAAWD